MIDYYLRFKRNPDKKTKYELDSYSEPVYSNNSFNPLQKPVIYLCHNDNIKAKDERKSNLHVSWNGRHLSSLFFIHIDKPEFSYGDVFKTNDLILFYYKNDILEIFILLDKKYHFNAINNLLLDNELDTEIQEYRNKARGLNSDSL